MKWVRSSLLDGLPLVASGFPTRQGGSSATPYASLNLGLSTGDEMDAVQANRALAARDLGFDVDTMAIAGQVHGSHVQEVRSGGLVRETDGLVSATPGILLCMSAADCASVLFADPEASVVGACHAGWRGSVGGVVAQTVTAMAALGARPEKLIAWISPCIGTECFEVGEEVADQFPPQHVLRRPEWPRPHINLSASLVEQLVEAGLKAKHVEASGRCTMCETDTFFSYRGEGGTTGRMMGFIGLKV